MTEDDVHGLEDLIAKCIADSLQDPDLASKSADYRAGYSRGFREAAAAFIAKLPRDVARSTRAAMKSLGQ